MNISGRGPKYNCTREILTTGCAVLFLGNFSLTLLVPTSSIRNGPSAKGANLVLSAFFRRNNTQSPIFREVFLSGADLHISPVPFVHR